MEQQKLTPAQLKEQITNLCVGDRAPEKKEIKTLLDKVLELNDSNNGFDRWVFQEVAYLLTGYPALQLPSLDRQDLIKSNISRVMDILLHEDYAYHLFFLTWCLADGLADINDRMDFAKTYGVKVIKAMKSMPDGDAGYHLRQLQEKLLPLLSQKDERYQTVVQAFADPSPVALEGVREALPLDGSTP